MSNWNVAAFGFSALVAIGACGTAVAQPVGTGFTYQGELRDGGVAVTGVYDFEFRLFDAAVGGTQVGQTLCVNDQQVAEGVFAVVLDFLNQYAGGNARYLEIGVRADAGDGCGAGGTFTVLSARQNLTATPFAVSANSATSAANASQLNGQSAAFYQNAANLTSGVLPSGRLSGTYSGTVVFSGAVSVTNPASVYAGSGSGLVGLNATNISLGTLSDARLSSNVARLNVAQVWSGANSFDSPSNSFTGDGRALVNLDASSITIGTLDGARIADNAIDTFKIAPNAIINSDLSDNSISTTKLVNGAVTSLKLATGAVSGGTGGVITDGSITAADLSGGIVTSFTIVDGTVGLLDLAPNAVVGGVGGVLQDESITSADLAANSVAASELVAGSVGPSEILGGAVGSVHLAAGAVDSPALATDLSSLAKVSGGQMQASATGVGVGGAAPTGTEFYVNGDARVESSMRSNSYLFLTPVVRTYTVSPWDFGPLASNSVLLGPERLQTSSGISGTTYRAPVHIPTGAIVTSMRVQAEDDDSRDITVSLIRRDLDGAGGGTMAQVITNTNVAGAQTFEDATIGGPVISNNAFYYYVMVDVQLPLIGSLNLRSVTIEYSMDFVGP